jgi:hypothetical protein
LFYFGPHPVKKRFQFYIQALHNYEKIKLKLSQKLLHNTYWTGK